MKSFNFLCVLALFCALPFTGFAQVGSPAPNFTVTDTHGNTHTLYNYLDSGKVVVLDFFYTTCGPCQYYSPQVNLAYEKYGCNDAEVLFMSIDYDDTNAEVLAYDNTYHIEYPSVSGLNGGGNAVVNQYQILGFPTFYVIDSSRTIVAKIEPPTLQVFDYRFGQLGIQPAACLTGVAQVYGLNADMKLFPNPVEAGESLQWAISEIASEVSAYQVVDFTGRVVQEGQESGANGALRLGMLAPGAYVLKVVTAKGICVRPFVVE